MDKQPIRTSCAVLADGTRVVWAHGHDTITGGKRFNALLEAAASGRQGYVREGYAMPKDLPIEQWEWVIGAYYYPTPGDREAVSKHNNYCATILDLSDTPQFGYVPVTYVEVKE